LIQITPEAKPGVVTDRDALDALDG